MAHNTTYSTKMGLPENFVKENLEKAKGSVFYGVPIEDLTRDELIACCVAGWQGQVDQRKDMIEQLDCVASNKCQVNFEVKH